MLDCTGWRQPLIWGIFLIWTQSLDVLKITWKMRKTSKKKKYFSRRFSNYFWNIKWLIWVTTIQMGICFKQKKIIKFGVDTFNFKRHIFMWNGGTLTMEKVFLIWVCSQNEWLSPTCYSQIFRLKYQLESTTIRHF